MNTLIYIGTTITLTKQKKMLWREGPACDYYSYFNEKEYHLLRDDFSNIRLVVYYGENNQDTFTVIEPRLDGVLSRLYLIIEILNINLN